MVAPPRNREPVPEPSRRGKKRRRRRAKPGERDASPNALSPNQLVQSAVGAEAQTQSAAVLDVPLGSREIAEMKQHLRFLRDYKRVLKLKLNAQEDLLLNGAREPETRGICHHLLSKVDYQQVAAAAGRMEKAERPKFVAGVLRFKNDLSYLLLYLECLRDAAHGDATVALQLALERLDFSSVSEGQMRRVLDLIVELFGETERAALLLGLLESATFRAAFDGSLAKLPDGLSELVVPLRAVHAVVFHNQANPADAATLAQGVELLLRAGLPGIERRSDEVRSRLLTLAIRTLPSAFAEHGKAVQNLLKSFEANPAKLAQLELLYTRGLIRHGQDKKAESRLTAYEQRFPHERLAGYLRRALSAPRFGRVAALGRQREPEHQNTGAADVARLFPALCLDTQASLWLRVGEAQDRDAMTRHAEQVKNLVLPGVARVRQRVLDAEVPLLVYARGGELLHPQAEAMRNAASGFRIARQYVALAAGLATGGYVLPDLALRRFEHAERSGLVLLNLWGITSVAVEAALESMLALVKGELSLFACMGDQEREPLHAARSFSELSDALDQIEQMDWTQSRPLVFEPPRRLRQRSRKSKTLDAASRPAE